MQLKRVNPKQILYHYLERSPSEFVLFDDEMDMPVAYGSRNLVDSMVRNLSPHITVIYYKRDMADKVSFKKKMMFQGKKEKSNTSLQPHPTEGLLP
jgi:hypothetical protein